MSCLVVLLFAQTLWAAPQPAIQVGIQNSSKTKVTFRVSAKCLKGPERETLAPGSTVVTEWSPDTDAKCKHGSQALTLTLLDEDFHWDGVLNSHGIVHFKLSMAGSSNEQVEVVSIESHELTGTSTVELKIHP